MIVNNLIAKLAGFGIFYRWHPEVALRYLPLVKELKKRSRFDSILEVGSGGMGITPYLNREVTGLDSNYYPPFDSRLKMVKGSVLKLPFKKDSFDSTICVDTLEHLSKNNRVIAIKEMVRVTRSFIAIAVPCGKESQRQDVELQSLYSKTHGEKYHFLDEQVGFGLPEKEEIRLVLNKSLKNHRKEAVIKMQGNENLKLRGWLMRGWIQKRVILQIFYRKLLIFAIPMFCRYNQSPYYRYMFFVTIS